MSTTLTTQVGVIRPHLSLDDLVARGGVHLLGTSEDTLSLTWIPMGGGRLSS
ncbi:hypothetical protein [Streptomyces eurocidicus]|uniref:Uncharacterized protein n=1 Tax=Streptomyces eurocidicus TaxID=66423 RepID=A0A7W8B9N1_STREU|nr:hypothetical protein [Streptomyces eurocidicus]MBB5119335.1 hypothetical protein [Streptomyces eurocidicus]MBF6053085.1 hypothetical protein [Streptomyces eurocidicus]